MAEKRKLCFSFLASYINSEVMQKLLLLDSQVQLLYAVFGLHRVTCLCNF